MDLRNIQICKALVPKNYLANALNAQCAHEKSIKELLEKRKLNDVGWPEERIEMLIRQLALLDSNNFMHGTRVGERESRLVCPLVARRNYNLGHGIGRSGDLLEPQPKAAGSTIIQNLTNALVLDLIHFIGLKKCECLLVPMATGMTLTLCMLALKKQRPKAKYVLWSRIDQKSCFKSITTAGLTPVIIEQKFAGTFETDVDEFKNKISEFKAEQILCLYTTTSCFAPREPDDVISIARIAKEHSIPHLINHAYGLQSSKLNEMVNEAVRVGRVDYLIQSTDKNFMTPVGGAIAIGFQTGAVTQLAKTYAGRASSSQSLDLLMTLLYLGKDGYKCLMEERDRHFKELRDEICNNISGIIKNLCLINTNRNEISLAIGLRRKEEEEEEVISSENCTALGSMLFTRGVSGARVIVSGDKKAIDGYTFLNWGSHCSDFKGAYITVAATVGMTREDIQNFSKIFIKTYKEISSKSIQSRGIKATEEHSNNGS